MSSDSIEQILSDIGALAIQDSVRNSGEAFLYAEAGLNYVAPSLFEGLEDRVVYRDCSRELSNRILHLWNTTPADQKWRALFLTVSGDQFDAHFQYSDEWNEDEGTYERRPRVLTAKYGDKPIDYSQVDWGPNTENNPRP